MATVMTMDVWVWAFFGGMVGAVWMDVAESCIAKIGITSGVNIALVGRWFLGLLRGQFIHKDIRDSKPFAREVEVGLVFHLLMGGGCVALVYPLIFQVTRLPFPDNPIIGGLLFGLSTSLLPWFVLLPSFGWGLFGRRGPQGANALLASTLSHIPYGLGIAIVLSASRYA